MVIRITGLVFIFVATTIGWMILGGTTEIRTSSQDNKLKASVGQLWGTEQAQQAPTVSYIKRVTETVKDDKTGEVKTVEKIRRISSPDALHSSAIDVDIDLNHRKKGLLWYPTYKVGFAGEYVIKNNGNKAKTFVLSYKFPSANGIYDDFKFVVGEKLIESFDSDSGVVMTKFKLEPNQTETIRISYASQGMKNWWYRFGDNVSQIRNFNLTAHTDFHDIDFPENGISPTAKETTSDGWDLTWQYDNLISGIQIGLLMPQKLNPGPFASRVSFFAPVSLFLFFFLIFIITLVKKIKIHPMNYFFIAASFFSFHLLMAYLVDHINLYVAFILCAAVSMGLVISYMKLVLGIRYALFEIGLSQFIYLVLFSAAFFLEGFTGLAITILCILTLFALMQYTGRLDWDKLTAEFKKGQL